MNPPDFIYFDLGNVVVNFSHQRAAAQMAEVAGVEAEVVIDTIFEPEFQRSYERGDFDLTVFFEHFCKRTGSSPEKDQLLHAASDIFWLNEAVADIVLRLSTNQSIRIGILSNNCDAHWQFLRKSFPICHRAGLFDTTVLSFEQKCVKPDPEIYFRAAEMADLPIGSILFIDDRNENVAGAIAAGMDAVQFHDDRQLLQELSSRGVVI